jgi:hypothetical protein
MVIIVIVKGDYAMNNVHSSAYMLKVFTKGVYITNRLTHGAYLTHNCY